MEKSKFNSRSVEKLLMSCSIRSVKVLLELVYAYAYVETGEKVGNDVVEVEQAG